MKDTVKFLTTPAAALTARLPLPMRWMRAAAGQPVSSALVQASGELRVRMDGLVSVTPHQVHLSHSFETHTVLATLNPTPNILGIRAFYAYL